MNSLPTSFGPPTTVDTCHRPLGRLSKHASLAFSVVLLLAASVISARLGYGAWTGAAMAGCIGSGCGAVTGSEQAWAAGLPVGAWGALVYLAAAAALACGWRSGFLLLAGWIAGAALWFTGLQAFAIGAWCAGCLATHGLALGGLGVAVLASRRKADPQSHRLHPLPILAGLALGVAAPALLPARKPAAESAVVALGKNHGAEVRGNRIELFGGEASFERGDFPLYGDPQAEEVAVLLWDPACGHCRTMQPALREAGELLAGQKLAIVAIPVGAQPAGREWARLMQAAWHHDPSRYPALAAELAAPSAGLAVHAGVRAAERWFGERLGGQWDDQTPLAAARHDKALSLLESAWKHAGQPSVPLMVTGDGVTVGALTSAGALVRAVRGERPFPADSPVAQDAPPQPAPPAPAPPNGNEAPGTLEWVKTTLSAASSSADTRAMWVDPDDHVFAVGRFVGTVDFFGTSLTATSTTVPSGFIAKFNPAGTLQWVRKIATDNFTELYAVAGFPNGEILVGGTAAGNFSNNGVSFSIPSAYGQNGLLIKLNANGDPVWAQDFGTASTDEIRSLTPTRDGEIVFGGYCITSITLVGVSYSCQNTRNGFVASVNNSGLIEWGVRVTGVNNDSVEFVDVDSENNIIVGVNFNSPTAELVRLGETTGHSVSGTGNQVLVAKYAKGESLPTWVRAYSGTTVLKINKGAVVTPRNDVLLGGSYAGTVNFGGPSNMPVPVGASGFIVKLDKNGNFQWQKQVGDGPFSIGDQVMNLAVAPSGVIGVTGFMRSSSTQLEGLPPFETSTTSYTGLFAMMDPQGNFLWADKIVGSANVISYHIQAFSNSDFVIGGYTSAADFGSGTIPTGPSNREAYLARYQGFPYPEIAVEESSSDLSSGGTAVDFGNGFAGAAGTTKTFTIRNAGTQDLTGIVPILGGTHSGDFILDASATAATLAPEATTTFSVQFFPSAIGARSASVSIASNDYDEYPFVIPLAGTGVLPAVSVAVSPESVAEDGAANLAYTFTRNGPTTSSLTVDFAVSGEAVFGTDYTQSGAAAFSASTGSVTFATGSATAVVMLDPTADSVFEPDESAILTVSPGSGYEVGSPAAATGTILNDDTEVSLALAPATLAEDAAGTLTATLTRNGPLANALTVNLTVGGTAGFGTDYTQSGADTFTASAATVTFAAGSATAVVELDPATDSTVELDETVSLTVTTGSGYGVGAPATATGTIANDDTLVPVQFPNASAVPLTLNGFTATGHTVSPATLGFEPTTGMILTLVSNTSANPIGGVFDNLADGGFLSATFGGKKFVMIADYAGGDGNDLTLTVVPSGGTGVNPLSFTWLSGGRFALGFQGTPDEEYQVQRSTILTDWTVIATLMTDSTGALGFIDESPPPGRAFYRVAQVSNYWGNGSDGVWSTTASMSFPSGLDGDVVVKQYSNLTINAGHTVTTSNRCRGLVIYVNGDCTIHGTLSMTARGANVNPTLADSVPETGIRLVRFKNGGTATLAASDLGGAGAGGVGAAWRSTEISQGGATGNGTIYTIARIGGAGGSGNHTDDWWNSVPGYPGGTHPNGTGGGGGGAAAGGWSGSGAAGTCYSGGSGGGAVRTDHDAVSAGHGGAYGGAGGYGNWNHPHAEGGGGAGNPGGSGLQPGQSGTGGLLVLLVKGNLTIGPGGQVVSQGSNGGSAYQSGGGSGGGRILILHAGTYSAVTPPSAAGGTGGGAGGAGAVTIDQINP